MVSNPIQYVQQEKDMGFVRKEMLQEEKRRNFEKEIIFSKLYNGAAHEYRGQSIKEIRAVGHTGFR